MSDKQILDLGNDNVKRMMKLTWKDIIKNNATDNYDNDESKFKVSQKEFKDSRIESWKKLYIQMKKDRVIGMKKSMSRLQNKLDSLI